MRCLCFRLAEAPAEARLQLLQAAVLGPEHALDTSNYFLGIALSVASGAHSQAGWDPVLDLQPDRSHGPHSPSVGCWTVAALAFWEILWRIVAHVL